MGQQNQDPKLRPGHPQSYHSSGLAVQPRVAKPNSNTSARIPMPHIEFDPYLATWVETSPRPSPKLKMTLQLHKNTYERLNIQKPTANPSCRPKMGQAKTPPEVDTQAVADTGAQMDTLSLNTLKSLGFDPDTLVKVQVRVTSANGH